jgi:hypothetical protein
MSPSATLFKSALQQTPICGLEKPGFPYPAEACQGLENRDASPAGSRRRHAVAICADAGIAHIVDGRGQNQKQRELNET